MSELTVEELILLAEEVATKAHQNQVDLGNVPYIEHPRTVASLCSSPKAKIIAWLHDVLEDTPLQEKDLIAYGFPKEIIEALRLLTKKPGDDENYEAYILRLQHHPLAREVKIADLTHNSDITRIPNPTTEDFLRLEKYQNALSILTNGSKTK